MFQKKTVFVVGAGASKEFGMPTGDDLRNDIVELTSRTNAIANSGPLGNFRAVLMSSLGPEWTQLQTSGFELAAALPTFVSIDEALHYFSSDERIVRIGKIAVAYLLLKYERSSKIAITRDTGRPNPSNCSETWLAELFSMALSFAKRENVREAFENIHFINFNYDRVIEQYICAALAHLAGLSQEDAEQIAANLNMIRPYGDLGPLAFSRRQGVAFGFEPYAKGGLVQVAEGIRTYTEQMEDPSIRLGIEQLMQDAELVIFVGFGFHQQNVALLRASGRNRPVFATAYKIDKDNYNLFAQNLKQFFGENIRLFDKKGYETLAGLASNNLRGSRGGNLTGRGISAA